MSDNKKKRPAPGFDMNIASTKKAPVGANIVRPRPGKKAAPAKAPPKGSGSAIKDFFARLFHDKRFRHGGISVVLSVLFIGLMALSNLVASLAAERFPALTLDLTGDKIYTLSDVTLNLLDGLEEDVQIWIFASEDNCVNPSLDIDPYGHIPLAYELIKRYSQYNSHIQLINADLVRQPGYLDIFDEYRDVLGVYSIAVTSARRTRITSFFEFLPSLSGTAQTDSYSVDQTSSLAEARISSLIKTVTIPKVPSVVYIDGLGGGGEAGNLLDSLYINGYDVAVIDFRSQEIPQSADIAVISSPDYDITISQWEKLENFLENGGNLGKTLMVFTSGLMPQTPNLNSLLSDWGIETTRDIVYETDLSQRLPGNSWSLFTVHYGDTDYTNPLLDKGAITGVSGPLEIMIPTGTKGSIMISPILASSPRACAAAVGESFDGTGVTAEAMSQRYIMAQATYYADTATGDQLNSAIVVAPLSLCDDTFFASGAFGNRELLMSVCNRRCGILDENLNIAPKSLTAVDFSMDSGTVALVTSVFGYAIPAVLLIAGLVVYLRRRRL